MSADSVKQQLIWAHVYVVINAIKHRFPDFFLRDPLEVEKFFRGPMV